MTTSERVLEYKGYIDTRGFSPSIREIEEGAGLSSPSHTLYHLQKLGLQGKITRASGIPRSIVVIDGNGKEQ